MCGIAGLFHHDRARPVDRSRLQAMTDAVRHRGPDGEGVQVGPGYGLGHRRLAIVDIAQGQQPMGLPDGSLWVTFNGEIYNHEELRAELEGLGCVFRTASDTEVLLHGWRHWGEALASRLRGMFAFALVDVAAHRLYAARDRLGKKPFYWTERDGTFAYASELKALLQGGLPGTALRPSAVARFLCLRYVPDPDAVFEGVHKLPPAHWLSVRDGRVTTQRYWRLSFATADPAPAAALQERTLELLDEAVRIRLMGEVPLAPFLSGGIDSYAVVDCMTRTLGRGVQACTIGFDDPRFDERAAARASARACGATLREEVVRAQDLTDLDWYDDVFDEPFSDSSAVPTFHVSRLARRHVTVALSGDGGDEGFAGYRRYLFDWRENRWRGLLPRRLWGLLGAVYPKLDWLPRWLRCRRTLQNLALPADLAYARSVSASLPEEVFAVLRPEWHGPAGDPLEPVRAAYRQSDAIDPLHRAVAADLETWLPGDILVKVDRASMAVALEVRAPFLDHVLLEHAARIPAASKLAGGRTKAFLRAALARRLEPSALQRRKQGFSVPLRDWLRGTAGTALEDMLGDSRLGEWLDPDAVRGLLQTHRQGVRDHAELLWACYTLGRFLRRWGGPS